MKGDIVKKKLIGCGYQLKDVAEMMKISPQNLHSLLNARDIKTGLLEKIAKTINKSVYFFFEPSNDVQDEKDLLYPILNKDPMILSDDKIISYHDYVAMNDKLRVQGQELNELYRENRKLHKELKCANLELSNIYLNNPQIHRPTQQPRARGA